MTPADSTTIRELITFHTTAARFYDESDKRDFHERAVAVLEEREKQIEAARQIINGLGCVLPRDHLGLQRQLELMSDAREKGLLP